MNSRETLANAILTHGWYREGSCTLSSGKQASYYVDLRPMILSSRFMYLALTPMIEVLMNEVKVQRGDLLCGVISSGLAFTGALLQRLGTCAVELNGIYYRTEHRTHGLMKNIEGVYERGQRVIVIDDVATSGNSLATVISGLLTQGLRCDYAAVILDREEGAAELLKKEFGAQLISCCSIFDVTGQGPTRSYVNQ